MNWKIGWKGNFWYAILNVCLAIFAIARGTQLLSEKRIGLSVYAFAVGFFVMAAGLWHFAHAIEKRRKR